MSDLSVMILCGRSPRHLYVANRLCRAAQPVAIVQETGTQWTAAKLAKTLKPPTSCARAGAGCATGAATSAAREAKFFFGDAPPKLDRPDLVLEVPHINDPQVVELAERTASPTSSRCSALRSSGAAAEAGAAGHRQPARRASRPSTAAPIARSGRCTTASPTRSAARSTSSTPASTRAS